MVTRSRHRETHLKLDGNHHDGALESGHIIGFPIHKLENTPYLRLGSGHHCYDRSLGGVESTGRLGRDTVAPSSEEPFMQCMYRRLDRSGRLPSLDVNMTRAQNHSAGFCARCALCSTRRTPVRLSPGPGRLPTRWLSGSILLSLTTPKATPTKCELTLMHSCPRSSSYLFHFSFQSSHFLRQAVV